MLSGKHRREAMISPCLKQKLMCVYHLFCLHRPRRRLRYVEHLDHSSGQSSPLFTTKEERRERSGASLSSSESDASSIEDFLSEVESLMSSPSPALSSSDSDQRSVTGWNRFSNSVLFGLKILFPPPPHPSVLLHSSVVYIPGIQFSLPGFPSLAKTLLF